MSLILNIDTALDIASVCLAKDEQLLQFSVNENQKEHSSWLHNCIAELMQEAGYEMKELDAIAVSIGPGSYTGLRVGLAAAKGFCYALQIPLITVNTLKLIAFASKDESVDLICPMIDARRMEVFTAVYDKNFVEKVPSRAMILDESSFDSFLSSNKILFCGNGVKKLKPLLSNTNASFSDSIADASHLAQLSYPVFLNKQFADLAYSEPFYLKEFYSLVQKG
ncbi:MAG: tRNA (adenosine(37)-N6)-threonylcarbamoyltransferase complex dimerization subunit type 1 TsaB [Chitinophagaceae bacterium]|nr:tRNA (adenosine(37)-N6)-threonylcarbamoyltransferase complex dimerization subunit type 1 TsaB [Chitinophagaceae bacterium]